MYLKLRRNKKIDHPSITKLENWSKEMVQSTKIYCCTKEEEDEKRVVELINYYTENILPDL